MHIVFLFKMKRYVTLRGPGKLPLHGQLHPGRQGDDDAAPPTAHARAVSGNLLAFTFTHWGNKRKSELNDTPLKCAKCIRSKVSAC